MRTPAPYRQRWELTREAFEQLLAFLDSDVDAAAKKYEEIRRALIKIFTCRGCSAPEELADETIDRVARKAGRVARSYVGNPALYFYGVARWVHLESVKTRARPLPLPEGDSAEEKELADRCLEQCVGKLTPRNHELILEYYRDDKRAKIERRERLAERLGIGLNALRIRAHRIRSHLQSCVSECIDLNEAGEIDPLFRHI